MKTRWKEKIESVKDDHFLELLEQVQEIAAYNARMRFLNLFMRDDEKWQK
jgi:hypothetical protein